VSEIQQRYNKQMLQIIKLCKNILEYKTDVIEAIRKIKTLNYKEFVNDQGFTCLTNLIADEGLSNFCTLLEDETDTIPKGKERKSYPEEFLRLKEQEEKEILEFYKKDLKAFARETIILLEKELQRLKD
jgi:hypothetical protein